MRKLLSGLLLALSVGTAQAALVADHRAVTEFDSIPAALFDEIRDGATFFYGHTSHGSQIMTGIALLAAERPSICAPPAFTELDSDLGSLGDLTWAQQTRAHLADHPETDVVMWSWCGGCSDNTDEGIDAYLHAMTDLETDFPAVTFIYMTGHLDGTGVDGVLYHNNNRIRDYCRTNDKILYDFADIESWDPDGAYYPDETDACGWCAQWCATADCPSCESCAHSHCFNCYRKGQAFWCMMARSVGWQSTDSSPASLDAVKSLFR